MKSYSKLLSDGKTSGCRTYCRQALTLTMNYLYLVTEPGPRSSREANEITQNGFGNSHGNINGSFHI